MEYEFWEKAKKYGITGMGDIVAIISLFSVVVAFVVKTYWYIFEWGYYNVLGIDMINLEINSENIVYQIAAYIGMAIIMGFSNLFILELINRKKMKEILLVFLVEVILVLLFLGKICGENIIWIFRNQSIGENVKLFFSAAGIVGMVNVFSILGFVTETGKGENGEEIIKKNIMHGHNTFWIVLLIVLILVLEGFYFYMMGADNANQKKDYKVVLIEVEEREEDGYQTCMTKVENQWVYVYPILFEGKEYYIISPLYKAEDNAMKIDFKKQRTIKKEGVDTYQCEDIDDIQ